MKDCISLTLPTKSEYVSVARLTASVVANNMGFDIESIEDIKVAVGEACNNAVLHAHARTILKLVSLLRTVNLLLKYSTAETDSVWNHITSLI